MHFIIEIVFVIALVAMATAKPIESIEWYVLVALPFAVLRTAVTISENQVMGWLRRPFCNTSPDSCGAGDSVSPKPGSVLGELIACPICSGTWGALILVGLYQLWHPVGVTAILALGAAGASEFLYYAKERNAWSARFNRVRDGHLERCDR